MEPQKEKTVRHPKKSKKRKLSPNKLGRATGPMRPRWDLADRQLEFKVSHGEPGAVWSSPTLAPAVVRGSPTIDLTETVL
jgi:hypothetical protein